MIELDLQIVLDQAVESERAVHGHHVRGWYLPSADPADWMVALNECCSGADYRLYVAPTSISDIQASGLIYLAASAPSNSQTAIHVPLGAIGLVGIGSSSEQVEIWIPSNARLEPNISLSQLAAEVENSEPRCYVWLPSVGLTAFEPGDEIALTRLLSAPVRAANTNDRQWTALPEIDQLPDRIFDIIFPQPEPFEQMFEREQDEIGGDSEHLTQMDDQGNPERQGALNKLRGLVTDKIGQWLRNREAQKQKTDAANSSGDTEKGSAGNSARPSLTDRIANQLTKVLQSQRDKQLDKLLKLLQSDPDKALRFAIPLAAMSAFRGMARPSNHLAETNPDFSLSKLFGSGPVDPWHFSEKMRNQLQAAYRKQAERELAAGRFRRAAYIHAHLLGDLAAAATILERGKAYREAAVIYGDKLKRPRDQARCLALAGQSNRAAQIYEELNDFEAAAKVWEDAAEVEQARLAYTKAVEQKIANFQILAASKLLDEKLDDRASAESLLWEQWPEGYEVLECTELAFRWLAESGKHGVAHEKFEELALQTDKNHRLLLAKLSAGLAKRYPDRELRETAEDRCRVVAGTGLRDVREQEMVERLGLIRSLQADDVLLRRDTNRFEDAEKQQGIRLQPVAPAGSAKLNPLPAIRLPEMGEYMCGEMIDGDLFALTRSDRVLYGLRAAIADEIQSQRTYVPLMEHDLVRFLKTSFIRNHSERIREIYLSFQKIAVEDFGPRELHPPLRGRAWQIFHNPLDGELCGGFGHDGVRWSLSQDSLVLHGYSNTQIVTRELLAPIFDKLTEVLDPKPFDLSNCKMLVVSNTPVIALGQYLFKYSNGGIEEICDLGCPPNSMTASLRHTASRIAIATDQSLKLSGLIVVLELKRSAMTNCSPMFALCMAANY